MEMEIICRICRNECSEKLISLLKIAPDSIELKIEGEKFEYCFGLKVAEIPNYSGICTNCEQQLDDFYKFKQQAIKSHCEFLRTTSKKNAFDNDEIKMKFDHGNIEDDKDPLILETFESDCTESDNDIIDNSSTEAEENEFEENKSQMYFDSDDELQEENLSQVQELKNSQKKTKISNKAQDEDDEDDDCSK